MTQQLPPKIQLVNTADYRENYANSVQIRVNLWDFFLLFGSPQQAKALLNVLQQNVTQYETAFGEIALEPSAGNAIVQ
jgi:flagellar protein FlaG